MARSFCMFSEPPRSPVELASPLARVEKCERCELHLHATHPCIPPAGEAGGVLIIGDGPNVEDDARGMPFVSKAGKYLRDTVAKLSPVEPMAYTHATLCPAGKGEAGDKQVDACRGYLAATIAEVQPTRIVCAGNVAMQGVLGRSVPILSVRRGYGWVEDVPVFLLPHPLAALRNCFVRKWFEEDLANALRCPIPQRPHRTEEAVEVETVEETERALADMYQLPPTAFDCETAGRLYGADFRLLSLSMTDGVTVYVWGEAMLKRPDVQLA